jgi:hypothetical protein
MVRNGLLFRLSRLFMWWGEESHKNGLLMRMLGAAVVLITIIIGFSVFHIKRPHSREK